MVVDQDKTLPCRQAIEGLKDRRVSLRRRICRTSIVTIFFSSIIKSPLEL